MTRTVHGGLNHTELKSLGLAPGDILDFSANINPLGTAPGVLKALHGVDPAAYPDPGCLELREALGAQLELAPDHILAGNGSTELIHMLARAWLKPGARAVIFTPAFGEYEAACRMQGIEPALMQASRDGEFRWDLPVALDLLAAMQPALVFLGNPNNPTGSYLEEEDVDQFAGIIQDCGLLVLDEAYLSFVDRPWDARPLLERRNVALLRSMTKDHALAGLRLGYLLALPETLARISPCGYSWSVNALAQAAGIAALEHQDHIARGREAVHAGREFLQREFRRLGLECGSSAANFLLVKVGDAAGLRRRLLQDHGLCVRDCASFGLPEHIRIGVRALEDCRCLINALEESRAETSAGMIGET
ncbi:MAG: histidinol-phosphate aminotransferase family protein [Gammaproteobacteria bacterium]|nr:histidinol-phosphate aminotransferase family protein [Gammaproteobacteria bacterium]